MMLHLPKQRMDHELGPRLATSQSQSSSLALSALSTPLATERTQHDHECLMSPGGGEDYASTKPSTTRSAMDASTSAGTSSSMVMAKLDISDLFAPLEARLFARMDAIEAMVDRRCGALEREHRTASAIDDAGLQSVYSQMEGVKAALRTDMSKTEAIIADLYKQLQCCQETMQNNVGEIWRQLKADRQDGQAKYQNLSDALESGMQSLLEKVQHQPSHARHTPHRQHQYHPASMTVAEEDEDCSQGTEEDLTPRSAAAANGNIIRAKSTPTMVPPGAPPAPSSASPQGGLERFSTMPSMPCSAPRALNANKSRDRSPVGCPLASAAAAAAQQHYQPAPREQAPMLPGKLTPSSPPANQPRSPLGAPVSRASRPGGQSAAASPRSSPPQRDAMAPPSHLGQCGSSPLQGLQRRVSSSANPALRPSLGNMGPPQRPVQSGYAGGLGAPGCAPPAAATLRAPGMAMRR